MTTNGEVKWAAPGPGGWRRDDSHMPDPMCGYMVPSFLEPMLTGMSRGFRRYGMLLQGFDVRFVRGRGYMRARPVGAPEKPGAPPPRFLFKLMFLLHPELRRRRKRAAEVWATRPWREDLKRWLEEDGPRLRQRCLELQAVDPTTLDDAALRAHFASCHALFEEGCLVHFDNNPAHTLPVGDWAYQTCAWTGASACECMKALAGSSPASSETTRLLDAVAESVLASPEALAAVRDRSGDPAARLARLRASSARVASALGAYLDLHGWRIATGFDLVDQCLIELPGLLLGSIEARIAARGTAAHAAAHTDAAARLRERVPPEHRAAYDALLEEARTLYGLRDEDVGIAIMWPEGLLRRALLAAGARLSERGMLRHASHVFETVPDELRALLGGDGTAPGADAVAERAAERARLTTEQAPLELGQPEAPPPDDYFPPECSRMTNAIMFVVRYYDFDGE